MPRPSFPILLYIWSVPVKLLLANAMGCRIVLSGTVSFWHFVHLHVCSSAAPRPTPEVSVSKSSGLYHHKISCTCKLL